VTVSVAVVELLVTVMVTATAATPVAGTPPSPAILTSLVPAVVVQAVHGDGLHVPVVGATVDSTRAGLTAVRTVPVVGVPVEYQP